MAEGSNKIEVEDNPAKHRFEAHLEGYTAIAQYTLRDDLIIFTHTEVPVELEGKGVASTLIKAALENVRERELVVVPLCPFVAGYIKKHQEYLDLVHPEYQADLQQK